MRLNGTWVWQKAAREAARVGYDPYNSLKAQRAEYQQMAMEINERVHLRSEADANRLLRRQAE
jgi:hypothetical protein